MFKISIKYVFMLAIAGLVATTSLVILLTSHVSVGGALVDQMQQIVARDAVQAATQTRQFLDTADGAGSVTTQLLESGALSMEAGDALEAHLLKTLEESPQLAGIFVAGTDGSFVYSSRDTTVPGAATRTKVITVVDGNRSTLLSWRSTEGWVVATEIDSDDEYDPTTRPWYTTATESGGGWSEPYVFYTARAPGVTRSFPVVRDGRIVAVVGLDVELQGLSTFLAELKTSQHSSAVIVDEDLQVVAHPDVDVVTADGDELGYHTLDEIDDVAANAAYRSLASSGQVADAEVPTPISFDLGQGRHHAAFTQLGRDGLPWLVMVQAPESDYLGVVADGRRTALFWASLITAAAVIGAYLVARSLSRPIAHLAEEAEAVANGRLESPVVETPYIELEQTAAALRAAYNELDRKVVERTVALAEEARERKEAEELALAMSRKKSDYLASVSHELRTPLTSIIGFADMLAQPGVEMTEEERIDYVRIIGQSGDHVLALVDELLDLARIESGESRLDETNVDLRPLLSDVARLVIPQARQQGVAIELDDSVATVRCDERRIRQVILNLVANAIKYTPEGGIVRISVGSDGRRFGIEVADDGVGMTAEEIETARRRFGRVESTADVTSGTGLGLALSEQMMLAHDGGLDISSVKGEGTTVVAWMPAERIVGAGPG